MRAVVAVCSSDGSKPSRGVNRLAQHLRLAHPVEAVGARLVALGVPRVDVPVGEPALDRVRLDVRVTTSCSSGFRYSISTSLCPSIALRQLVDETLLLADVRRGRLGEVEGAERLLELRADAVERRVRAGGDHRPDELEREPDRARLERRQPRGAAERVAEELLVDVHLVALQLRVDGVAAAAEVDEVEQREVLLELLGAGSRSGRRAPAPGSRPRAPRRRR